MEILKFLDVWLFYAINQLPHDTFLVVFFSFLSGIGTFGIIWALLGVILIWWEGKNRHGLYGVILSAGISLVSVEIILKNVIQRLRPEYAFSSPFLINATETYSFPSTHATIAYAASFILSASHPRYKRLFFILAFLIAFSRIYLGKHYPSDVLAGAILGILIGFISEKILKWKMEPKIEH